MGYLGRAMIFKNCDLDDVSSLVFLKSWRDNFSLGVGEKKCEVQNLNLEDFILESLRFCILYLITIARSQSFQKKIKRITVSSENVQDYNLEKSAIFFSACDVS